MFSAKRLLKKIMAFRKDNRITQVAFAKQIGISAATLVNWERERSNFDPSLTQIVNMAKIFGVTPGELLLQGKDKLSVAKDNGKDNSKTTSKRVQAKAKPSAKVKASTVSGSEEKSSKPERKTTVKKTAEASKETTAKKLGRPRKSA